MEIDYADLSTYFPVFNASPCFLQWRGLHGVILKEIL